MFFFGGIWNGLWLVGLIGTVWVIVDILNNQKKMDQTEKIIWIVAAIIAGIITAPVYYFVKKKQ